MFLVIFILKYLIFIFIAIVSANPASADLFELQIVHFNDFHSRFEQTNWNGGSCTATLLAEKKCVGGFARMYTKITTLMKEKSNSILLCGGDNFQGTLWYTTFRWKVIVDFFNKLPLDAVVLGNHEFDDKIAGLLPYIENLNHAITAANIDDSEEPRFQGKVKESVVIERGGRKIGIIGYLVKTTNVIASTENLRFFDEVETVNRVASKLKKSGVDIIIGLSHSGISVDLDVAKNCPDLDVVVGGHSHTLLYTGTPPGGDTAEGVYPTVVTQESGRKVLVVQAGANIKYLGSFTVKFDEAGEVVEGSGNPILLDHTIVEDPTILKEMEPYKKDVDALSNEVIGTTKVFLENTICRRGECSLGNLITDAMVFEQVNRSKIGEHWAYASIAATNAGGIRSTIDEVFLNGVIKYGDLVLVMPFQNSFDVVEILGKHILEILEFSVSRGYKVEDNVFESYSFLQWSGLRVKYDLNHPIGSRVLANVTVLCNECRVPEYEPLDIDKYYRVVLIPFLIDGGDGYEVIQDNFRNRVPGREETDVLRDFLKYKGPVVHGLEGRIHIIQN